MKAYPKCSNNHDISSGKIMLCKAN